MEANHKNHKPSFLNSLTSRSETNQNSGMLIYKISLED